MTDTKIETLIDRLRDETAMISRDGIALRYSFYAWEVRALLDALEKMTAERDTLRAEAREAHDALVWMAVELGWATDGRLKTAVGHAKEVLRVRTAERDRLRALRDRWQEVVTARDFTAAVEAEARGYHDSACSYQRERDAALAAIREALELVESAPTVPIHVGGGNLVSRQKMVQASDVHRILSRALEGQTAHG